jgi:hypothetical protein
MYIADQTIPILGIGIGKQGESTCVQPCSVFTKGGRLAAFLVYKAAAGNLFSIFRLTAAVGPTSYWFSCLHKSKAACKDSTSPLPFSAELMLQEKFLLRG